MNVIKHTLHLVGTCDELFDVTDNESRTNLRYLTAGILIQDRGFVPRPSLVLAAVGETLCRNTALRTRAQCQELSSISLFRPTNQAFIFL